MQTTNSTAIAMKVRQPVGTNHFQFRDHQFRRGGCGIEGKGGGGVAGELDSIASFSRSTKSKSRNFTSLNALRLSRQFTEKRKIESEYAPSRVRLIKHEEDNTIHGIGSRGSVRVGTG